MKKEVYIFRPSYVVDKIHLPYFVTENFEDDNQYYKELESHKFDMLSLPYGKGDSIIDSYVKTTLSESNVSYLSDLFNGTILSHNKVFELKKEIIMKIDKMCIDFLNHINITEYQLLKPIDAFKKYGDLYTITHIKTNGSGTVYKSNKYSNYSYLSQYLSLDELMSFYWELSKEFFNYVVEIDNKTQVEYTPDQVESRLNQYFQDNNIPFQVNYTFSNIYVDFEIKNKYSDYCNFAIYSLTNKTRNLINDFMSENYKIVDLKWYDTGFITNQLLIVKSENQ